MAKRVFTDAPTGSRCQAVIVLRDKTTAQCGRAAVNGKLCSQHAKMADPTRRSNRGKCLGCGRVWGAAGSEGQCSRCRRCLACCSDERIEHSCVRQESGLSYGAAKRSNDARERYHDNPAILSGYRGRFER